MDSGNTSGSMQSSSGGGDEEYDSRAAADPISTTFPTANTNHHHHHHQQTPSPMLFDPSNLSNFFTTNHHLDTMAWPRPALRSDPIPPDLISAISQAQAQAQPRSLSSTFPPPPPIHSNNNNNNIPPVPGPNDSNGGVVRNPKKRSRASRRAPTTVLTTDTTNFRAMVQEFTGIPAPPFTSSPFPRTRLDLFGSGSGSPLLLRPFAHKPHAAFGAVAPANPVLSFNSLLQPPPKFPALAAKTDDHFSGLAHGINPFAPNWAGNDSDDHDGFLRSINGGFVGGATATTASASEQVMTTTNGKTTSDFHVTANKATETRSEGMLESWICSSD